MSNLLGVVKAVIGLVYVVEPDGSQRLLKEGDRIYTGEEVVTSDNGAVSLSLPDGKTVDIGRSSHWGEHGLNTVAPQHTESQDVAALQKAIADGADPTKTLEATAAGNEPPLHLEGGGGGHTLVQTELTGLIVDPNAGFNTTGIGEPGWRHDLPVGDQGDHASSVLPPLVHIDFFAGNDNYVNRDEIHHADIKGTSNKDHVVLQFTDSQNHTLTVEVPVINGRWETQLDLSAFAEGHISVEATATDVAGRVAHSTTSAIIDETGPQDTITVHTVAGDDVVNGTENRMATHITGDVGGDAQLGDRVVVRIQGQDYTDEVIKGSDGKLGYDISIPVGGLKEGENTVDVTVFSQDKAGNTASAHTQTTVLLDTHADAGVMINDVTRDNTLNHNELSEGKQTITGNVDGDAKLHDTVHVQVNGHDYYGEVTEINGKLGYSIDVDSSAFSNNQGEIDTDVKFTVSVISTDNHGNQVVATSEHTTHIDNHADAQIRVHTVAGDNVVNSTENRMATHILGDVSGDAREGDRVVVRVQGQEYTGEVVKGLNGHLSYDVAVPVGGLKEGLNTVGVTVYSHDDVGNETKAHTETVVTLDTHAKAGITINDVTPDNTLNHNELTTGTQTLTGHVSGDAKLHDTVHVQINGHDYYGEVIQLGKGRLGYSINVDSSAFSNNQGEIDADVKFTVSVISTDNHGNQVVATSEHTTHIDNHADAQIRVHTVAGDNVVNSTENRMATHIQGDVGGDARVGDKVVVNVLGREYTGVVVKGINGHLSYDVAVPVGGLKEGLNTVGVTVYSHDDAGNETKAHTETVVTLDTHAKAGITINDVTPDNTLNHNELTTGTQTLTGHVSGDAKLHDTVHVQINGHDYYGEVIPLGKGRLGYSIDVKSADFSNNQGEIDKDVKFTVSVISTDNHGNQVVATSEHTTHIDNHADAQIRVHTVAGDNVVNSTENRMATHIQGDVGGDARVGDKVVVNVLGREYTGEVVKGINGHLSYDVAVPVGGLKEGLNTVGVTVYSHDDVGNETKAHTETVVTLDTHAKAGITINDVTPDNTLNHNELTTGTQTLTGHVSGDAKLHDTVHVQINGHDYYGEVIQLGKGRLGYSINVDSSAFSNNQGEIDADVKFTVSVISTDNHGNQVVATSEHTPHIDNHSNTLIHIHDVAGDNVVNGAENRMATHIQGDVGGDARDGDRVVVRVQGQEFIGEVVNGAYDIAVPVGVLKEGHNKVDVSVYSHDNVGNTSESRTHTTVLLDTHAKAAITINDVTQDNTLNHSELNAATQAITGTVGGDAKLHDTVHVQINGHDYYGEVTEINGRLGYSIDVPPSAFSNNQGKIDTDVKFTVSVISTDIHGNPTIATAEHTTHIDNHAENALTIDAISGDDWVSAAESNSPTFITGDVSGLDAKVGDAVAVKVQNHTYTGTVFADANGNLRYEVAVPRGILIEGDNAVDVTLTSRDGVGNVAHASLTHHVTVDTQAQATISINPFTDHNTLNHTELDAPKQVITGSVGGDAKVGDVVVIEINGYKYPGQVIALPNKQLGYSIVVDSYAFSDNRGNIDTDVKVNVSVVSSDHLNNVVTAISEHTVHIDNHADAHITVDLVTGDDTINHTESREHLTKVTGTVSGDDVHLGDKVFVTVNGHDYETTVVLLPHQNGALGYNVDVLTKDVLADPAHTVTASITGKDNVGNEHVAEASKDLIIDLQADASITIDPVTANHDNMINGEESKNEFTVVTGMVGGDAKEGDLVTLHVNGIDLTGKVDANHHYSINVSTHDLMADPHITATVHVTDQANNAAMAQATQLIIVDTKAIAHISVDSVTDDNTLNGEELNHRYSLVTGKVSGEMHAGDPLTLKINGHEYKGKVELHADGSMGYQVLVETRDIHADPTIHASISVTDEAGNNVVATDHHAVVIDDHANASLTINIVSGDDILNHNDQLSDTTIINGRVGGDVKNGDVVNVKVGDHVYHAVVEQQPFLGGGLGYSIPVETQVLLNNPHIVATVDAKDAAGNTITVGATHDVSRDDGAVANITIDSVTDDNTINNDEAHKDSTIITGSVSGDVHIGDQVDLVVNGQHYYGSVIHQGNGLGYKIDVSTADLISGNSKPVIHASVTGSDTAGNTVLAEFDRVVNVDTRADAEIKIGSLELNGSRDFWVIEGTVGGDAKVGDVVKIFAGGKTYETTVQAYPDGHLGFSGDKLTDPVTGSPVYIDAHDLDNNADVTVQITSTDPYGNHETASAHLHANVPWPTDNSGTHHNGSNTNPPQYADPHATITINTVAGDNTINKTESASPTTVVRGTVSGDVHAGDHVTVHVGDKNYDAIVSERPNLPGELSYEVRVDTQNLMDHPDITASVTAHNGGTVTHEFNAQKTVDVDTDVNAHIQLDNIAGDNTINIVESQSGTTIVSGTVSGDNVHVGSNVTINVNGHDITTQVFADTHGDLKFSKEVSVDDLRQNPTVTVSVTGNDDKGNVVTVSDHTKVNVDTDVSAHVTIDKVTSDNTLNLDETKNPITEITGKVSGDVHAGDSVTLMVNGHKYHAVVADDLSYKAEIKTADLQADHNIVAQVTGYDAAQNSITHTESHAFTVDTTASGTISINTVSGDNILSAKDLSASQTEISGVVGGDARVGDEVKVSLNGHATTVKVIELPNMNGQLGYSMKVNTVDLNAELDAQLKAHPGDKPMITVTVSGADDAGNTFSQSISRPLIIDDHADVALHINNVSGDNVLSLDDSHKAMTEISGTVTGDVHAGNNVIVHVNGNDLNAKIENGPNGELTFKVSVNTSELLQDPKITYTVTGVDAVGNTLTITESNKLTLDQHAENSIHVNTVAGDNRVNIAEFASGQTQVTGTVHGDVHAGDKVTLVVNGHTYQGIVAEHTDKHHSTLTYDIAVDNKDLTEGDNSITVSVTGKDAAGNTATSTETHIITVDTHIDAAVSMNTVSQDNIINAKESAGMTSLTGQVTGDAREGDRVTLEVNNHEVITKVVMVDNHLGYDVRLDSAWLHEGVNDVKVSVSVSDEAHNHFTATQTHQVTLDSHADAHIVIDKVTGDNHLSHRERHHDQIHITGSMDGDVHDNDSVTVTVGDQDYTGQLHNVNGHLTYDISVLADDFHPGLNDVKVTVDARDQHGNITQQSQHVDVTVTPPEQHGPHGHHAGGAQLHALNNLFDSSHEQLSFNSLNHPNHAGHHGAHAGEHMQGGTGERIDLSTLYHELHHGSDITSMIAGGDDPIRGNAPQPAQHVKAELSGAPVEMHAGYGDHSMSVPSLDHLLGRPDHQY
ncbi:retention module-containing protein [Salmonella enterica subsp. enterica serovar Saintpaul]|nr:retention module-containing protein [Salmonella enterica subsp. enterica serovar Saintpaul]